MTTQFRIVFATCGNNAEAKTIATYLLENKLIACANILPDIESMYLWEGKLETTRETKLILKTKAEKVASVIQAVKKLHSYDVPEIQVVDVATGNLAYFNWIDEVMS